MKMVVDLPEDRPRSRHGLSHVRLSRAGDFRLPLRASGPRGYGGHFRALLVSQPRAHVVPLLAAFHAASIFVALSAGREAALVGRQVAAGIGPARRAVSGGQWIRAHRRRLGQHQRAHRVRAWTKHGPPARNWPKRCSNCCARASRSTAKTWSGPTWRDGAPVGWKRKAAWPRRRATVSTAGVVTGLIGHGAGRLHQGQALARAASRNPCRSCGDYYRGKIPAGGTGPDRRATATPRRLVPRCAHGALRLAGDSLRRPASGHAPGRPADRRQSAGAGRIRRPRALPVPRLLRTLRNQAVHRDVLGPGH